MLRRLLGWLTIAAMTACAGSHPGARPAAASRHDEPARLVERYIDAVRAHDFDAARQLWCSEGRAEMTDKGRWLAALGQFERLNGPIGPASASVGDRTGMKPLVDLPGAVEVRVFLTIGGSEREPLRYVTVIEHGERRVCGRATKSARRLAEELSDLPPAGPDTALAPRQLLPAKPPPGDHLVTDEAIAPNGTLQPGFVDGWVRRWQHGASGGALVDAERFDTIDHARAAARHYYSQKVPDAAGAFAVPGVPYAGGVRVLGFAWLGVQTTDVGPDIDFVYAVLGRTLIVVAPSNLSPADDHSMAIALLRQVVDVARRAPAPSNAA